jgi:threonine dehydratase
MADLIGLKDIEGAKARIAAAAVRTPLVRLSRTRVRMAGFREIAERMPEIYLKDESAQPIGSFKLRGAYNKIAQLSAEELGRGVITYSSGNHAQGVAYAARALGAKAVIVMPSNAPQIKREATGALGGEIVVVGTASSERREKAEELAALHGYTIVPPYDDAAIIAGQATCGVEILEQLPGVELVLSPVSGGGLLSGVGTGIKLKAEAEGMAAPQVWGCEPELAGDSAESFKAKMLVEWPAEKTTRTICDGLRTQSLGDEFPTYSSLRGWNSHGERGRDSDCGEGDPSGDEVGGGAVGRGHAGGCSISCGGIAEGPQGGGDFVGREPGARSEGGARGGVDVRRWCG